MQRILVFSGPKAQDRLEGVSVMLQVGSSMAAEKKTRVVADLRSELQLLDMIEEASTPKVSPKENEFARLVKTDATLKIPQALFDKLVQYMEAAAPVFPLAQVRAVLDALDWVKAASTDEEVPEKPCVTDPNPVK